MFILLTVFLFIFLPLVMLILYLARPRFNVQGFLAILAVLAGWILVFLARPNIPSIVPLFQWKPDTLFTLSPSLMIDHGSWYFALALTSLALSTVITSIVQLGRTAISDQVIIQKNHKVVDRTIDDGDQSVQTPPNPETQLTPRWLLMALILIITSLGLLAVTAGNILTLLLAWTALDIVEIAILLGQLKQSRMRERIILAFSAKMVGLCIVLVAGILLWSHGASLSFDAISGSTSTFLVFAAGLRLGVLPLHLPYTKGLPINRDLGTVLRLVPATSNYILLVRASSVGVSGAISPYLLGLTILAGVYAAINWLRANDEIEGRPYWLLGSSSLVVVAAILGNPPACLAWGIGSLLSGGLIFSMSLHHKYLTPLVLLGLINLSAIPFSPTWQGTTLYQYSPTSGVNLTLFSFFSFFFLLVQAFLLAGFMRHALRGIFPIMVSTLGSAERWIWFLYPLALIIIIVNHLLIGWWMLPNISEMPMSGWIMGPTVLLITGIILFFTWRYPQTYQPLLRTNIRTSWDRFFSLDWLYNFLWRLYRTISRIFSLVSAVLEGDGGLLWALVLFGLIFVFLQR